VNTSIAPRELILPDRICLHQTLMIKGYRSSEKVEACTLFEIEMHKGDFGTIFEYDF
jgi:hypothetical protein